MSRRPAHVTVSTRGRTVAACILADYKDRGRGAAPYISSDERVVAVTGLPLAAVLAALAELAATGAIVIGRPTQEGARSMRVCPKHGVWASSEPT